MLTFWEQHGRLKILANGSPSWTRTNDISINSRMLYQLSYQGIGGAIAEAFAR